MELLPDDMVCHLRISVMRERGVRRWLGPQAVFRLEGIQPFEPYPLSQAFPMFEWGLNWCIAMSSHYHLLLHSAVLEKDGKAVILPAQPGSGKTTLCAGLVGRGWRLLSDEFGIVRHSDGQLLPLPRAAPLKNESIPLLAESAPQLSFGPRFDRTRKGDVVHLFPPRESLERQLESATPRWIVFPRFQRGAALELIPQPPIVALTRLVGNSFNYRVTGVSGFRSMSRLIRSTRSFQLLNGDLAAAVDAVEQLLAEDVL